LIIRLCASLSGWSVRKEMIRWGWRLMSGLPSVVSLVLERLSWAALSALPG
jgi:hypothetical protein